MYISPLAILLAVCFTAFQIVHSLEIGDDFRTPKNIVFAALFGGSSHINWVLNILGETVNRGHNVTYVTKDDHVKFGKYFPGINTVSIGEPMLKKKFLMKTTASRPDKLKFHGMMMGILKMSYAEDFNNLKAMVNDIKPDVLICDHFAITCCDVASIYNIPFIVTAGVAATPDASAPYINNDLMTLETPTTLNMPFHSRFYNKFILPIQAFANYWKVLSEFQEVQRSVGAPPFSFEAQWADSLKIIQSAFGFEAARPLGPLVEFVGPIVNPHYSPLTPELSEYLNQHRKIVYIAFGQSATPATSDITLLLKALIDNYEKGTIDGFLWATVHAEKNFPKTITTLSNKEYDLSDILEGRDPHLRLLQWAPQQAILLHPSTVTFLTHGGLGSLHEGLLARKRLAVFPFFGDQPGNARMVEANSLGGHIDYRISPEAASEVLQRVVLDKDGKIQQNLEQYHALVKIRSKNAPLNGADLIEEVLFMNKDGKLPHRYEVSRQMSFIKAHNIDLYVTLAVIVGSILAGIKLTLKSFSKKYSLKQKLKKL